MVGLFLGRRTSTSCPACSGVMFRKPDVRADSWRCSVRNPRGIQKGGRKERRNEHARLPDQGVSEDTTPGAMRGAPESIEKVARRGKQKPIRKQNAPKCREVATLNNSMPIPSVVAPMDGLWGGFSPVAWPWLCVHSRRVSSCARKDGEAQGPGEERRQRAGRGTIPEGAGCRCAPAS